MEEEGIIGGDLEQAVEEWDNVAEVVPKFRESRSEEPGRAEMGNSSSAGDSANASSVTSR